MALPSASRLPRAFACAASAVLPTVDRESPDAERGTAIHAYLSSVAKLGRDAALAIVPEEYRARCESIDVEQLPIGAEYLAEVALAYDVESGAVRFIGLDVGRSYGPLGPNEVAMSLDVLGATAERVYVGDFKTGRGRVPAAERNWQLRIAALAAAKWKGVNAATVAIIRIGEDGVSHYEVAHLDAFDLGLAAADLRALAARIEAERALLAAGQPARATMGEHCKYCPSLSYCPAQANLIRRMAGEPEAMARDLKMLLTPETATKAYERVRLVEDALKQVRAALYAYAAETPIQLADGHLFGSVDKTSERLDALVVRQVLAEHFGAEVADKACDFETSKAGIERGLRLVYEARKKAGEKVTLKALNEAALAEVRKAGGVEESKKTTVCEYKP